MRTISITYITNTYIQQIKL